MKTKTNILLTCLIGSVFFSHASAEAEQETKYLAFQIFTTYSTDPKDAQALNNGLREPLTPGTTALRNYVLDIKQRIGIIGDRQTRLAVMLGPLTFDQTDAEITQFIERAFDLALETDMAVGFHIDDCILWSGRKDLWSNPQNVEALDWDGTPCTGRRLNYGKTPMEVAPQMCFNSKAVQREVRQRAALIGRAIAAGVKKLEQLKRPEMFAGVISGWETQMGSDLKTGKYLGYRALLNRGFSREHPPKDLSLELENITQEFIGLWTAGLGEAGAPPQKIYSHITFLSHRAFGMGDNKQITYMKRDKDTAYSQHNHYTPPAVAFGKDHRPGFSTYPQPGLCEDIYEEVTTHKQVGWASCEGTNMQPLSGPGETGMNMETYLAKMFNHGATLTTIFSWGIGGEAHKNMDFRVCTEGEEALQAYRKFLKGESLIEGKTVPSLSERLSLKVQTIQKELPAWMQKADTAIKDKAMALMQQLQQQAKGNDPHALEKTADAILELMGMSAQPSPQRGESTPQPTPPSSPSSSSSSNDATKRIMEKIGRVKEGYQTWMSSGRDASVIHRAMEEKFKPLMDAGKVIEAEAELDRVLEQLNKDGKKAESPTVPMQAAQPLADPAKTSKAGSEALVAADNSSVSGGPPAGASFPPEIIFLASDRIGMTSEQREAFQERVEKTHARSEELRVKLERETAALAPLTSEEAIIGQLDKVRACADELKQLHTGFAAAVTKLLTPEQRAKLIEVALGSGKGSDGFHQLEEAMGKRIADKQERVQAGIQKWVESGRDPAAIRKTMEETVAPLLKADRPMEIEAALDRVLKQLGSSTAVKSNAPATASPAPVTDPEALRKRLTEKVALVQTGARKWAESGRDYSAIARSMQEKFKPLMEAGKTAEAEVELDRLLEQLKAEAK